MSESAPTGKQWSESELNHLTVEKGFRLRGLETTRLDTFIDAAFAFVLTLLVISFDELPANYEEMVAAMKQIPGFMASFSVMIMFWMQHRAWSRRYGIENTPAVMWSLALIFVVFIYVYPLRTMFGLMFAAFSGGVLESGFEISTYIEFQGLMIYYSSGFFVMCLIVSQLYQTALNSRQSLGLNATEAHETRITSIIWLLVASFGLLSVILVLTVPPAWIPIGGYIYFAIYPVVKITSHYLNRNAQSNT